MDTYSKTVLTVIAIALCGNVLQNSGVVPAFASQLPKPLRVEICGQDARELFRDKVVCAKIHPDVGLLVRAKDESEH